MFKFSLKPAFTIVLVLSLIGALAAPAIQSARAEEPVAGTHSTITPENLRPFLESAGAAPEAVKDNTGDPAFKVNLNGLKAAVFFYDRKGDSFGSIQIYAVFSGKASSATVNLWNRRHRFSRAYLDSDGDPSIESDLDLNGGVSDQSITRFIERFKVTVIAYQIALSEARASSDGDGSDPTPAQSV